MNVPESAISAFGDLPTGRPENAIFRPTISRGYKAKTTRAKSPRRRRTERDAISLLDRLKGFDRRRAVERVRSAKQPVAEAQRILARIARNEVAGHVVDDVVGHADVQELRAKIIRRDYMLDQPQAQLLARMDRMIASDGMTKDEFAKFATALLSEAMRPALPLSVRREAAERGSEIRGLVLPPSTTGNPSAP